MFRQRYNFAMADEHTPINARKARTRASKCIIVLYFFRPVSSSRSSFISPREAGNSSTSLKIRSCISTGRALLAWDIRGGGNADIGVDEDESDDHAVVGFCAFCERKGLDLVLQHDGLSEEAPFGGADGSNVLNAGGPIFTPEYLFKPRVVPTI